MGPDVGALAEQSVACRCRNGANQCCIGFVSKRPAMPGTGLARRRDDLEQPTFRESLLELGYQLGSQFSRLGFRERRHHLPPS
jgi:hypothetical protein